MKEELLKELDNDSLKELLLELENLDQECEKIINEEGASHE
jgi:hypothetical protein